RLQSGQESTVHDRAVKDADVLEREHRADEVRRRANRGGAADLPEDVTGLTARAVVSAHHHGRAGPRDEGAHGLEYPDATGRPGQRQWDDSGQTGRRAK